MKKFLLFVPLLVFLSCGGDNEIEPGATYIKYFGGEGTYELKDMILRADGNEGVVMFGIRDGADGNGGIRRDGYIIEADGNGNLVNELRLPLTDANGDEAPYAFEASRITAIDGGYLVVGSNINEHAGSIAAWAQLDSNLEMVGSWDFVGDSVNNYYGVDINVTADGGVLVAGYTDDNIPRDNDFFYTKVGGTATDWSRIQRRANSDDQLVRALPTSGGDFAIFGRTDAISEAGELGVNVERSIIDQEGVIINSLIYGTSVDRGAGIITTIDDIPYDVIEKPGGFTVVGDASDVGSYPFMMNVDLTGAVTNIVNFENDFATPELTGRAFGVTQSLSNDFIVIGELIDFVEKDKKGDPVKSKNNELMVMRTDQSGARVGGVSNFGLENGEDKGVRVLTAPDGSILVGGTFDFGGGLSEIALLKMNVEGELKQ